METRELDVRISEEADRDLHALRRHCGIAKTGALFLRIAGLGLRPPVRIMSRASATRRTRLTLSIRDAADLTSLARRDGVSVEVYVDAFLRHAAATLIPTRKPCRTPPAPRTTGSTPASDSIPEVPISPTPDSTTRISSKTEPPAKSPEKVRAAV